MKKIYLIAFTLFIALSLEAAPIRIMPLGDSITYDDSYADYGSHIRPASVRHAYRNYLYYRLTDAQYCVDFVGSRVAGTDVTPYFDPDNEGYPGKTSRYIANIVYNKLVQNPADIILLHIGTNDRWRIDKSGNYMSGMRDIFNEIDRYERDYNTHVKVILALIIGRRDNNFASFTNTFNRNLESLAADRIASGDDIKIVDMQHDAGLNYHSDFRDPAHPTPKGYEKMANLWFRALDPILSTMQHPNPLIKPFVERLYTTILLREGEEEGVNNWTNLLLGCGATAADVARAFIFSQEFINQNLDDTTFVKRLYQALLNRPADSAGLAYWEEQLANGHSRFMILNGFLHSIEFDLLSKAYDITAVHPSEFFVTHFYTKALGRDAEEGGFLFWVDQLKKRKVTASQIARAFFFSDEFIAKDTDDETFVTLLYRTLLSREPDSEGLNHWLQRLASGESRDKILEYFIYSPEFRALAQHYKITL